MESNPTKLRQQGPRNAAENSRRVEKKRGKILTWKATEDFATRKRCVHKQSDNSFRDGFAHESRGR